MNDSDNKDPKIIVDDDWKSQARAEKEELAKEQADQAAKTDEQAGAQPRELPPATFSAHVSTLASQAMFALGAIPDPQTQQRHVDLDLAKYCIDTLKMLEAKCEGNLTDEEKKLLDSTLYELRTQYIHIAQTGG